MVCHHLRVYSKVGICLNHETICLESTVSSVFFLRALTQRVFEQKHASSGYGLKWMV